MIQGSPQMDRKNVNKTLFFNKYLVSVNETKCDFKPLLVMPFCCNIYLPIYKYTNLQVLISDEMIDEMMSLCGYKVAF